MKGTDIANGLRVLQTQLSDILDPASAYALAAAGQSAVKEEKLYHEYRQTSDCEHVLLEMGWGFHLDDPHPLRFRECHLGGYCYRVDVLCELRWKWSENTQDNELCKRNLVLRIWSRDHNMIFREQWDSEHILESLTNKLGEIERVMLRFHFDRAAQGVSEPRDHIQVGGIARSEEHCWIPPQLDVPRVPYPPQDLYLLCELIGANFYPHRYQTINTDPLWRHQILTSQELYLEDYYRGCLTAVREGKSVLVDHLWQASKLG